MSGLASRLYRSLRLRSYRAPPVTIPALRASASLSITTAAATAALVSMAAYTSTVSKPPATAASVPEGVDLTAHHVKGCHGHTVRFKNPYPSSGVERAVYEVMPMLLWGTLTGSMPVPSTKDVKMPMVQPAFLPTRGSSGGALRATWLGHACYHVEFPSGMRVLFDPVFESRCGPLHMVGPKRFSPVPLAPADLPPVDAVVISHSHYDHLSHASVVDIAKRNPDTHFFVGLGLAKWFHACGISNVTELDWWEDADLVLTKKKPDTTKPTGGNGDEEDKEPATITARLTCLPAQHASGRTARDKNTTLWASWAISSGGKSVWFGGDTGYRTVPKLPTDVDDYGPDYDALPKCPQFKQIGQLRGPFDLGLIPIGAYSPRWMWSSLHASPRDAVEIFKDTNCRKAMGIHWGTWVLTSEEVEEPPVLLKLALRECGIPETGVFDVCALGETREF
ncbi:beta-lactamase superfamily domain-containing protein [Podospora appendiculata]|uniref:Beta-lactamase superfamily domain-containing protein n=1 Tax=Podospora appendiculata TaxID=314037 RepID=A0AAE1CCA0_9PEZI|nr:beta-lactamase superfamily domain-containing protein [Podospora appendiculata]